MKYVGFSIDLYILFDKEIKQYIRNTSRQVFILISFTRFQGSKNITIMKIHEVVIGFTDGTGFIIVSSYQYRTFIEQVITRCAIEQPRKLLFFFNSI